MFVVFLIVIFNVCVLFREAIDLVMLFGPSESVHL